LSKRKVILAAAAVVIAVFWFAPHTERFVVPLHARELRPADQAADLPIQPPAWLHVEVETSWGWFWQTSKGHAWVTVDKQDTLPSDVGKLCIRLTAHGTNQKCEYGAHKIAIEEKKRGVQIAKKTAIVTAWTELPTLDTVTVSMEP
jgi:hypothetical protein